MLLLGTVVLWHLPGVFEPASRSELLHATEHISLVAVATVYWATITGVGHRRADRGASLASIGILVLVGGAIGGLMTFSSVPWYPGYAARADPAGVDWLVDQQLAGVLMWLPMGAVVMGVGAWLVYRWQAESGGARNEAGQSRHTSPVAEGARVPARQVSSSDTPLS